MGRVLGRGRHAVERGPGKREIGVYWYNPYQHTPGVTIVGSFVAVDVIVRARVFDRWACTHTDTQTHRDTETQRERETPTPETQISHSHMHKPVRKCACMNGRAPGAMLH